MASTLFQIIKVYKADAAIAKGQPVKIGTDSNHVAKATASTDKIIGIAQGVATAAENLIEVAMAGGGAKALCASGGVTAGDLLTADSSSNVATTTTDHDRIVGVALDTAVSGDLFDVIVQLGVY